MKVTSLINLAVFNLIAVILASLVYSDRVFRVSYWLSLGFTPTTTYYPFAYITSASRGSTYIPGTLTIDWLQVILVVAVVVDGSFALGVLRRRRQAPPSKTLNVVPGAQTG
jgi:hypothetical protein